MLFNEYVVLGLVGIILIQHLFWTYQTHKLIDKLMSKNFAEYHMIKNPAKIEKPKELDPIEEKELLQQINGMLGV